MRGEGHETDWHLKGVGWHEGIWHHEEKGHEGVWHLEGEGNGPVPHHYVKVGAVIVADDPVLAMRSIHDIQNLINKFDALNKRLNQ